MNSKLPKACITKVGGSNGHSILKENASIQRNTETFPYGYVAMKASSNIKYPQVQNMSSKTEQSRNQSENEYIQSGNHTNEYSLKNQYNPQCEALEMNQKKQTKTENKKLQLQSKIRSISSTNKYSEGLQREPIIVATDGGNAKSLSKGEDKRIVSDTKGVRMRYSSLEKRRIQIDLTLKSVNQSLLLTNRGQKRNNQDLKTSLDQIDLDLQQKYKFSPPKEQKKEMKENKISTSHLRTVNNSLIEDNSERRKKTNLKLSSPLSELTKQAQPYNVLNNYLNYSDISNNTIISSTTPQSQTEKPIIQSPYSLKTINNGRSPTQISQNGKYIPKTIQSDRPSPKASQNGKLIPKTSQNSRHTLQSIQNSKPTAQTSQNGRQNLQTSQPSPQTSQNGRKNLQTSQNGMQNLQISQPSPQTSQNGRQNLQISQPSPQTRENGRQNLQTSQPYPQIRENGRQNLQTSQPSPQTSQPSPQARENGRYTPQTVQNSRLSPLSFQRIFKNSGINSTKANKHSYDSPITQQSYSVKNQNSQNIEGHNIYFQNEESKVFESIPRSSLRNRNTLNRGQEIPRNEESNKNSQLQQRFVRSGITPGNEFIGNMTRSNKDYARNQFYNNSTQNNSYQLSEEGNSRVELSISLNYEGEGLSNNIQTIDDQNILVSEKQIEINSVEFATKQQIQNENQDREEKWIFKCAFRTCKGYSPKNPNKENQDSYVISQNIMDKPWQHFFAVCDGHGSQGHKVSQYLKEFFPVMFEQQSEKLEVDTLQTLQDIYEKMNEKLKLESQINILFSGSTVSSLYFSKKSIFCANIGDSRAIVGKFKEKDKWQVVPLSRDHKPSELDEARRIIENNGRIDCIRDSVGKAVGPPRVWLKNENVPGLAMTRSMGDLVACSVGVTWKPEIFEYELSEADKIIVIASDGIWEFISNKQVMQIIVPFYINNDLEGACDSLMIKANLQWTQQSICIDDITFIIVFLNQDTFKLDS